MRSWRLSKLGLVSNSLDRKESPPRCSDRNCLAPATIIHDDKPYCGKHALARAKWPSSAKSKPTVKGPTGQWNKKRELEADPVEPRAFSKVGDDEEAAGRRA